MANKSKMGKFISEWMLLQQLTPDFVHQHVSATVELHAAQLAGLFYSNMMADDEAKIFLSDELVNPQLLNSMQTWLRELFSAKKQEPQKIYAHQCHVGEVHARIQIPIELVMRGARILKHAIAGHLIESDFDRKCLVQATNLVFETIALAMDAMTDSFVIDIEKLTRADESYRTFALSQNMIAERERQRAALLEWAHQLITALVVEADDEEFPGIRHSEFGMWLRHKASIVFESAKELEQIRICVDMVEQRLEKKIDEARHDRTHIRSFIKELETGIDEINFLLGSLFERFIEVESGRDSLTRLLNRRHLPTVLTREIAISRRSEETFALLLLDIDHFKVINDTFGHTGGDLVLQQAADLLVSCVRAGDFIFRYGGEELLVVLVDMDKVRALRIAEKIRLLFQEESFRVGDGKMTHITVSIGIATYNGSPDYETIVNDADRALYDAKEGGRNRSVLSSKSK